MRAMRLTIPRLVEQDPLLLIEQPVPAPASGQVLLRVWACGVCHTDLHTVEGEIHPPRLPITPGHQVVGVIEAIGEGIETNRMPGRPILQPGERVGVPWLHAACGRCEYCQRGEENLCAQARFTGFDVDGGYAEYMLAEARYLLAMPPDFSDEEAAPLLCAGIIGYRSLLKADVHPGERLGLVGFGASAHLAIQLARYWSCEVFVFTRSEDHRRHAEELGATWIGGAEDCPPRALDRIVIFAPAGWLVPLALGWLRPGGTLAINAIHMSPIPEMPYNRIYGERTLRSVSNATYQDGQEFLKLATEIPIRPAVTRYPIDQANQALNDLKHSRLKGEAVLVF